MSIEEHPAGESLKVKVRYSAGGQEQMGESFWLTDPHITDDGQVRGTVGNVLISEVIGYGDIVDVDLHTRQVVAVIQRSPHCTYGIGLDPDVPAGETVDAGWQSLMSFLHQHVEAAGAASEGFGRTLLISGPEHVVEDALIAMDADPGLAAERSTLSSAAPAGQPYLTWGNFYTNTWAVGSSGPEGGGWALIPEPRPDTVPPVDPDFTWDPMSDPQCVRYMNDHPLAIMDTATWAAFASDVAATAGGFQRMVHDGEGARVLLAVARMALMDQGMPLLPGDDLDEYLTKR